MKDELNRLRQDMTDTRQQIENLQRRLNDAPPKGATALDRALSDSPSLPDSPEQPAIPPRSAPTTRLMDLSLNTSFSAGCSTEDDEVLAELAGGAHDPSRCGFNFQAAELSLSGAVDPYVYAEAHVLFSESHVELEEAFALSTALPFGLQLKGGYFLTEFGRLNATHPHAWSWIDQPVVNSRLLGDEGMRGAGVRLGWLAPTPWYSQVMFGMQNADDATMISFRGEGHAHEEPNHEADPHDDHEHDELDEGRFDGLGGAATDRRDVENLKDFVYLVRWENAFNPTDETRVQWGLSGLFGPNGSGRNSRTQMYGTDLTLKWLPASNFRGTPSLTWQTEFMWRDYEVAAYADEEIQFGETRLEDQGLYTQLLYGFHPQWAIGLRYEYATGSKELPTLARQDDPARGDRQRVSPLLIWAPSHFSKIRLQYNYDQADFLDDAAHTFWLGFEFLIGSHPAHNF